MKIKWTKPSGLKIETNDKAETIEYCESLNWKREAEKKPRKPRTPKTPIVADNEGDLDIAEDIIEGSDNGNAPTETSEGASGVN